LKRRFIFNPSLLRAIDPTGVWKTMDAPLSEEEKQENANEEFDDDSCEEEEEEEDTMM
jgi:hypothetical protein